MSLNTSVKFNIVEKDLLILVKRPVDTCVAVVSDAISITNVKIENQVEWLLEDDVSWLDCLRDSFDKVLATRTESCCCNAILKSRHLTQLCRGIFNVMYQASNNTGPNNHCLYSC